MLAGWSSNNKFSLLGGLRSSAQMVSYELAMGLAIVVMFMIYGTTQLGEIVARQSGPIWNWGVFSGMGIVGGLAFVLFWIAVFAETNRMPFDLPEGEAELVAGYHTEYSSLRFALFFMAEYANMIVACAFTATLFFGGYAVPFVTGEMLREHTDLVLMVIGAGGAVMGPIFATIAFKRRNRPFYQALSPDDPRHREPPFWVAVWSLVALAHLGLAGLGAAGIVGATALGPEIVTALVHVNMLVIKILLGCWFMIWVRWTIPRFRYDQLMDLGWKVMVPVSILNVMLAGIWIIISENVLV